MHLLGTVQSSEVVDVYEKRPRNALARKLENGSSQDYTLEELALIKKAIAHPYIPPVVIQIEDLINQ